MPRESKDRRVETVTDLLSQTRRSGTFDDLARRVNLSSSRLRHVFKNEVGQSLRSFAKAQRLARARDLLETTYLSVKEVAAAVDAGDASHFARDFKIAFGLSPANFRKSLHATRSGAADHSGQQTADPAIDPPLKS
jgi:AraC family transcriptional regulator, arabinose operon regulatory protein